MFSQFDVFILFTGVQSHPLDQSQPCITKVYILQFVDRQVLYISTVKSLIIFNSLLFVGVIMFGNKYSNRLDEFIHCQVLHISPSL